MRALFFMIAVFIAGFAHAQIGCPSVGSETVIFNHLNFHDIETGGTIGLEPPSVWPLVVHARPDGSTQKPGGFGTLEFWISARDAQDSLRVMNGKATVLSGPDDTADCDQWKRFWRITNRETEAFKSDFNDNGILDGSHPAVLSWPGKSNPVFEQVNGFSLPQGVSAPFFDRQADGIYNPLDGDFPMPPNQSNPDFLPTILIWELFHTSIDSTKTYGVRAPLCRIARSFWGYSCTDTTVLNETVFGNIDLVNTDTNHYTDFRLALLPGFDLGDIEDDVFGTDTSLHSVFCYNNSANDSYSFSHLKHLSYGVNPPAVAFTLLNQPLVYSMYFYKVKGVCDPSPFTVEPLNAVGINHCMHSRWRNGLPLVSSSNSGYSPVFDSSDIELFCFTGDIYNTDAWHGRNRICPGNSTPLLISTADTLSADERFNLDFAFSFHHDTSLNHLAQVDYLKHRLGVLRQNYQSGLHTSCAPTPLCTDTTCVWPTDADHNGVVTASDFLPMALHQGTSGARRSGYLDWQGFTCSDWTVNMPSGLNIKHADANGNGTIDTLDLLLLKTYIGRQTPWFIRDTSQLPIGNSIEIKGISPHSLDSFPINRILKLQLSVHLPGIRGLAGKIVTDSTHFFHYRPDSVVFLFNDTHQSFYKQATNATHFAQYRTNVGIDTIVLPFIVTSRNPGLGNDPMTFIRFEELTAIDSAGNEVEVASWPLRVCVGAKCATTQLGENMLNESLIDVWPNPASQQLTVKSNTPIRAIAVFDLFGKRMFEQSGAHALDTSIDVRSLPTGIYLLKIDSALGATWRKVLVQ